MRDVTDNRTGELAVGEVKRGRGRPPKSDAMSNADRQRAYRARRRENAVTVTKNVLGRVGQVESCDHMREELEAWEQRFAMWSLDRNEMIDEIEGLRADLVEARASVDVWAGMHEKLRRQLLQAERERDEVLGWGVDAVKLSDLRKVVRASMSEGVAKKRVTKKVMTSASVE